MNPNFVIFMGDLIDGYKNDSSNLNKEWDEILCRISSINKPTFLVPGKENGLQKYSNKFTKMLQNILKSPGSSYIHSYR